MKTIAAFTPVGEMPPFVNISRTDEGVAILVRGEGEPVKGAYVCGHTCFPGHQSCNGYCRGQADKALPHEFTKCGPIARIVLTPEAYEDLRAQIIADMGKVDG